MRQGHEKRESRSLPKGAPVTSNLQKYQRIAPLYDLLRTVAYPDLSPKFAMKIGKRATLDELDAKGWAAFAADAGLGLPLVRRRVSEIGASALAQANNVADQLMRPGFDETALGRFAKLAAERAAQCVSTVAKAPD